MKRFILAATVLCLSASLYGCGGNSAENTSDDAAIVTDEGASENKELGDYYFSDNILVSENAKIEITDYKVIPVGEPGNEYGEKPVIAFWYNTTNTSGEEIDPSTAWIYCITVIQDNNPNMVNELEMGMLPDEQFLDSQMATIKKDGTVANAVAYELDDNTTPVILKATNGLLGEEIGEQTFEIQ